MLLYCALFVAYIAVLSSSMVHFNGFAMLPLGLLNHLSHNFFPVLYYLLFPMGKQRSLLDDGRRKLFHRNCFDFTVHFGLDTETCAMRKL